MERKFAFSIGEFYHLYNRGSNKMPIFLDSFYKQRFIKLLFVCNSVKPVVFKSIQGLPLDEIDRGETLVDIGAYCLMPNHFHFLVREKIENGISLFMGKLSTAYSMFFNKINDRTGNLFEGTFKATHANDNDYLKYLFSYIHLNPVKIIEPDWKESGLKNKEKAEIQSNPRVVLGWIGWSYTQKDGLRGFLLGGKMRTIMKKTKVCPS